MQKKCFEKFARIFSRRNKQTTFSAAVFLGALRFKTSSVKRQRSCQGGVFGDNSGIIMPPTSKKLEGHIASWSFICPFVTLFDA